MGIFVSLTEVSIILLLFVTILTQILIPVWKGTAMWPLFRKRSTVQSAIVDVNEELEVKDMMEELKSKKQNLKNK